MREPDGTVVLRAATRDEWGDLARLERRKPSTRDSDVHPSLSFVGIVPAILGVFASPVNASVGSWLIVAGVVTSGALLAGIGSRKPEEQKAAILREQVEKAIGAPFSFARPSDPVPGYKVSLLSDYTEVRFTPEKRKLPWRPKALRRGSAGDAVKRAIDYAVAIEDSLPVLGCNPDWRVLRRERADMLTSLAEAADAAARSPKAEIRESGRSRQDLVREQTDDFMATADRILAAQLRAEEDEARAHAGLLAELSVEDR